MSQDANRLIYEKSNQYRLHADKVRWVLLGGYAVFFGVTIPHATTPAAGIALFLVSMVYLLALAAQSWFYNLFSRFVNECESRIVEGVPLRPLADFAQEVGTQVTPFHPAFFFSMLAVTASSVAFLSVSLNLGVILSLLLLAVLYRLLRACFRRWDAWVYHPIIERHSNLFKKQVD